MRSRCYARAPSLAIALGVVAGCGPFALGAEAGSAAGAASAAQLADDAETNAGASADAGVIASQAPAAGAAEFEDEIGEVVVTARRRAEAAQDVPIAISVLDGATLESTGAFNVSKLTQLEPTLQFFSTNPRNTAVNIRGLGAPYGLTNDGIEQGVGIYVDEVYYSRIASATFDFLDVDRLEILRGPQGTLYGKNVTAGAINITTRAPSFEPEASAELSAGDLGFVQAKGSISGALAGDSLAGRLALSYTERDGTVRNVRDGRDVNLQDNLGVRGQLLWKASETFDLTFAGDYSHQNPECCAQIYAGIGATQRPLSRQYAALSAALGYAPPSTDAFDRLTDLDVALQGARVSYYGVWEKGDAEQRLFQCDDRRLFAEQCREYAQMGMQLVDIEAVSIKGVSRYIGLWEERAGPVRLYFHDSLEEFEAERENLGGSGLKLVKVERAK